MFNKCQLLPNLLGLGLLLSITFSIPAAAATSAQMSPQKNQFHQIEQPLGLKFGLALTGVALIGLNFWWFVFSRNQVPGD
jgi:plastocyanin domain-containing protein